MTDKPQFEDRLSRRSPYQTVIVQDRYGGTYSGGEWIAIAAEDEALMYNESAEGLFGDAFGGDIECMEFWETEDSKRIGRGDTPNDAVEDLIRRTALESEPEIEEPAK